MDLFSPAKINLFLKVLGKRPDGYHNLSSLFQAITLGDTLSIEPHDKDLLTCSDSALPVDSTNLILKALSLFRFKTGINLHAKVHLEKKIPIQAGLGGGSGNAATVLWACNQLTGEVASIQQLQAWSAEIGSDIPFFFSHGTAHCTGKGENVRNLSPLEPKQVWIIKPRAGLVTAEIFKRFKPAASSSSEETDASLGINSTLDPFYKGQFPCFNDLEEPAFQALAQLRSLKKTLISCGYETVLMSGSGSAFFCLGEGKPPQGQNLMCYPARFLNRGERIWYTSSGEGR